MQISFKGLCLGQKLVEKEYNGKKSSKIVARFDQPESESNALILVVLEKGEKLEPYKTYTVFADQTVPNVFNGKAYQTLTAIDIK